MKPQSQAQKKRLQISSLHEDEDEEDDDDDDDSDASSARFPDTLDSVSILDTVDNPMQVNPPASPTTQLVGTPPRKFMRRSSKPVTVAQLIGLSLLRYIEEKREPPLPENKMGVNWWTLRMMEDGEVDDDFPPLERTKPLASFVTANNGPGSGGGGVGVMASDSERRDNLQQTAEYADEEADIDDALGVGSPTSDKPPEPAAPPPPPPAYMPPAYINPLLTTTFRNQNIIPADAPQAPVSSNRMRGQHKLLRIHILTSDIAASQLVTVDVTTDMYLAEVLDIVCQKRQLDQANHVLKIPGSGAVARLDRPVASLGNVSDLELYRRRFATDGPLTISGSPTSASPKVLPLVESSQHSRRAKKQFMGIHPLTREALKQDELGSANYKKYTLMVYKGTESKRYDFEAKSAEEASEIVMELKKGIAPYLEGP
ncbi:Stress-activated map kinase-interacting protein 1 [Ceratocystis platani]|uniref:Stress-activated map kinase-interacting protein 1 n=1 Tax=Ceratocystis fimbriata f. sp. platani TaxID=88771 RepID=A0A0F8AZE8_CERFI|nr:Stress-activated map kinase-interacting protein 1 [Ceratocystis platani]